MHIELRLQALFTYIRPFQAGRRHADQRLARRGSTSAATTTRITIRPHDALALIARVSIGDIFRVRPHKVDGWLTVIDGTYSLFRDEYKLPLIPMEIAVHAAKRGEHRFPLLLLLGLFTRLSALALLGMTLVIQLFVYPNAWPTHLSWAGLLQYLVGRGTGTLSLDRLLQIQ